MEQAMPDTPEPMMAACFFTLLKLLLKINMQVNKIKGMFVN